MRGRWRCAEVAACFAALLVGASARAQMLDLGGAPIGRGEAQAAAALAGELERRASEAEDLEAALLTLSAALLRKADARGLDGATFAVLGRAIAREAGDVSASEGAAMIAAREVALIGEDLPRDVEDVERRLRDALALVTREAGMPGPGAGWFGRANSQRSEEVPERTAASAQALLALLDRSAEEPAYALSARRTRHRVLRAAEALEAPAWFPEARATLLLEDFERACGLVLSGGDAGAARVALERLVLAAALFPVLTDLPSGNERRDARAGLVRMLDRTRDRPADALATLRAVGAVAELLEVEMMDLEEARLVRQVRPAWRATEFDVRRSATRIVSRLPELFEASRPMSDPSVVALIAQRRRVVRRVAELRALSGFLASDSDGPAVAFSERRRSVADRVLEVSRGLGSQSPEEAEAAASAIRDLAEGVRGMRSSRGVALARRGLDAGASETTQRMREISGDRIADLLVLLERRREAWLQAWAEEPSGSETAALRERLGGLIAWFDFAADVAVLGEDAPHARAWPGIEVPEPVARAVIERAARDASGHADALLNGGEAEETGFGAALAAHAFVRLLAQVERRCIDVRLEMDRSPLHGFALGPPDPVFSYGARARAAIAAACHLMVEGRVAGASSLIEAAQTEAETALKLLGSE